MARVTVEDCLKNVKNRFELVILAAKRARQLMHGKEPRVEWDNDKATVVALREIAQGHTDFSHDEPREEDDQPVLRFHTAATPEPKIEPEEDDLLDEDAPIEPHVEQAAQPSNPTTEEE